MWVTAGLLLACSSTPELPRGVLLITMDTWRADHLDARITPEAWRLAEKGTRFTRAYTPIGLTTAAHASLFTGLLPPRHGLRGNNHHGYTLEESFTTLAESFSGQGWETGAFVSGWPAGPSGGMGQGFDTFSGPPHGERPTPETLEEARAWLAEREGPWLMWVHANEPHGPYEPPELDARLLGAEGEKAAYAAEVHAADRILGPLVQEVLAAGSHVVLTADHGEVLDEEACHWQHERSSSEHVLRVPMVLAGPAVAAETRDDIAGLHDLFPTLHHLAGLVDPGNHEGKNLLAGATGRSAWVGESGFCEADCSPGCSPPGFTGKDRVVLTATGHFIERPGTTPLGDASLSPHLAGYTAAEEPAGSANPSAVQGLGYVDDPASD